MVVTVFLKLSFQLILIHFETFIFFHPSTALHFFLYFYLLHLLIFSCSFPFSLLPFIISKFFSSNSITTINLSTTTSSFPFSFSSFHIFSIMCPSISLTTFSIVMPAVVVLDQEALGEDQLVSGMK